jgi:hypothetical protein
VRHRLRPVLLTRCAAVAAEVASLGAACDDAGISSAATEAEADAVLLAIGHALAPGAPASVVRLAAAAAAQRRWHATLARLLPAAVAAGLLAGEDSLLHAAARSGCARIVAAVRAAGAACGCAGSVGARGVMPLHLAASLRDAAAREAVLAALCDGDASAPLAWCAARDASGRTPAQYAAAAGGAAVADAALRARLAVAGKAAAAALRHTQDELGIFAPQHALETASATLSASGGQAALDAISVLCVMLQARPCASLLACLLPGSRADRHGACHACARQLPSAAASESAEAAPCDGDGARAARVPMRSPELRAMLRWPARMPGAFADAALEADWLADVSAHRCWHDAIVYSFCALIHLVEVARMPPPAVLRRSAQLLYVRGHCGDVLSRESGADACCVHALLLHSAFCCSCCCPR